MEHYRASDTSCDLYCYLPALLEPKDLVARLPYRTCATTVVEFVLKFYTEICCLNFLANLLLPLIVIGHFQYRMVVISNTQLRRIRN